MSPKRAEAGLYIHIPFCHARCGYCDFVTFTGKEDRIDAYRHSLLQELRLYRQRLLSLNISTVFFGGGTPSLLENIHFQTIFHYLSKELSVDRGAEITLEANPESVTSEKARGWREAGVNRVSLGLQAMDDSLLKAMGRLHDTAGFIRAYETLRQAGFDNISFDLIYGFPGQSLDSWKNTVARAASLAPEHLSLYSLTIEAHTPFAAAGMTVNNDVQAAMYEWARVFLRDQGYPQYEIANFARPGRECRHNLIYWRAQDYIGVGVGAVGCMEGTRWQNVKALEPYERFLSEGRLPRASEEHLDEKTSQFERLMLGLRLREGMEWGTDLDPEWGKERDRLTSKGLLEEIHPGRWRIPDTHVAMTNQVLLAFL